MESTPYQGSRQKEILTFRQEVNNLMCNIVILRFWTLLCQSFQVPESICLWDCYCQSSKREDFHLVSLVPFIFWKKIQKCYWIPASQLPHLIIIHIISWSFICSFSLMTRNVHHTKCSKSANSSDQDGVYFNILLFSQTSLSEAN